MTDSQRNAAAGAFESDVLDNLRHELGDESGDFIAELVNLYLAQGPELLDQMTQAAEGADLDRLAFAATR